MNKKIILFALVGLVAVAVILSIQSEFDTKPTGLVESIKEESNSERRFANILASSGSPVMGSPDAPITIMVLNDYQCQGCKRWYFETLPEIKEKLIDTNTANLVFIDVDLQGDDSLLAAKASYCADDQGKFWQYQEKLFLSQGQTDGNWEGSEQLELFAQEIGLDVKQFQICFGSDKFEDKIKDNTNKVKELGANLPAYIMVNSEGKHHIFKGMTSSKVFEQIINSWS